MTITKMDIRQSVLRSALSMIGSAAEDSVDSILSLINAKIAKLYEDRNVTLSGGGDIANSSGSLLSYSADFIIYINSNLAGVAPYIITIPFSSSPWSFTLDGNMAYVTINRIAQTATLFTDVPVLPAVSSTNSEVFLIAKRIGTSIVFRDGTVVLSGRTVNLGAPNFYGTVGATTNALVRSLGTDGKTLQSTGIIVDNSNNVSGINSITGLVVPLSVIQGGTGASTEINARRNLGTETVFNGLENGSLFGLSYSASTRELTVTYSVGAALTVNGTRYTKSGVEVTTAHANTTGLWFFSYDSSGNLVVSSSYFDILTTAPLALVYYNSSNNGGAAAAILQDERHPGDSGMDNATHRYLHLTRGTQLLNGIQVSGYTIDGTGTAIGWAATSGQLADEDLVVDTIPQILNGSYRILFKTGTTASPVWNWVDASESGIYSNGTNIYYNQNNAGTWQLTPMTAPPMYVNYWLVATTHMGSPDVVVVMGENEYSTLVNAQAAVFTSDVTDFGLFTTEGVVIYRATYERGAGYGAPGNAKLKSLTQVLQSLVIAGVGGVNSAATTTVNTGSFINLFTGVDSNVQQALNTLDAAVSVTGTANTLVKRDASGNVVGSNIDALGNVIGTAVNVTGIVAIANGGTGQNNKTSAFNALSPIAFLGDIIYGSAVDTSSRLSGNITTTKKFLTSTGDGVNSAAPSWETIIEGDLPSTVVRTNQSNTYSAGPQNLGSTNLTTRLPNDTVTGTTLNLLCKVNSSGQVVTIDVTDTKGILGVVVAGAGTSGSADIAQVGQASVTFDNATTAGNYVIASTTNAGYAHDAGPIIPTTGQILGKVLSTNGSPGTYAVVLSLGGGSGGGGTVEDNSIINRKFYSAVHPIYNIEWGGFGNVNQIYAVSFVAQVSEDYSWGQAWLYKTGTPNITSVRLELRADNVGEPGSVLGQADIAIGSITTIQNSEDDALVDFTLGSSVSMVAGNRYWVCLRPIGTDLTTGTVYSRRGSVSNDFDAYIQFSNDGASSWSAQTSSPFMTIGGDTTWFVYGFSEALIRADWNGKIPTRVLPDPTHVASEFTLTNGISSPTNVSGLIIDKDYNRAFKLEYSIERRYTGVTGGNLNSPFVANSTDGAKFNSSVIITAVQSDGKILVGGTFTNYGGTTNRNYLVRLNSDGTTDTAFCTNAVDSAKFNNGVYSIEIQSDNKILIAGAFTNYTLTGRNRLIRLNSDGTLDTTFTTNASYNNKFNNAIRMIKLQSDGKILAGGTFTNYNSTTGRDCLVRLNSDGTTDTAFCTNASDSAKFSTTIYAIEEMSNGQIVIGGLFVNYAGVTNRNRLIRLNSDGTLDVEFCSNASDGSKFSSTGVLIVVKQFDNKILVGGNFSSYAGTSGRNYFIRLNNDGTLDVPFCINAVDSKNLSIIRSIFIKDDNSILFGGDFNNYGGVSGRNNLAMISLDGIVDSGFCANASDGSKFSSNIQAISILNDQKILAGGGFINYAGTTGRDYLILVSEDIADIELIEQGFLSGIYKTLSTSWNLGGEVYAGDSAGITFSIDSTGQIKYVSTNIFGTEIINKLKYILALL